MLNAIHNQLSASGGPGLPAQAPGPGLSAQSRLDGWTDKISLAFYRTLSLWGHCPAYQPLYKKTVNQKKTRKAGQGYR